MNHSWLRVGGEHCGCILSKGLAKSRGEVLGEDYSAQKPKLGMSWVAGPLGLNLRLSRKSWVLLSTYYVPALF